MDNFDKFTELINYIEANLDNDIKPLKMAQILCVNEYTMYRIFTFLTGMTLTEYIRKRRLSMAAIELQNSNIKIIDLAIKYGYENSESFSRSFYKFHGIKPSKVKKEKQYIKNFPPYSFANIRTNKELHYKIEEHDEIELYGISKKCYIPEIKKIYYKNGNFKDDFIRYFSSNKVRKTGKHITDEELENITNKYNNYMKKDKKE